MASPVFEIFAKLGLDSKEFDDKMDGSEKKALGFGDKLKGSLGTATKVMAGAVAAAGAAIVKVTTDSIKAYAEYEQLTGGVQKLFGNMGLDLNSYAYQAGKSVDEVKEEWQRLEDAQNLVMENARQAYKTAGMDMNQYMETATGFSGALIKSLNGDTLEAARITDVAMKAMSDNVNTFGTDAEAVSNAFMGLSRQNYMMIDNLKLGYSGTAQGMMELINDSGVLGRKLTDTSELAEVGFDKMIEAIQAVQEQQGIAGTTAREAEKTISGSVGMMRSAWKNLVIGMSDDNADIDSMFNDLTHSAEQVFTNILPVAERALSSITSLIGKIAPLIAEKLPELVGMLLPTLISAATSLVIGIVQALPEIISVLIAQAPVIITQLVSALIQAAPLMLDAGKEAINQLVQGIDINIPELIQKGGAMLDQFLSSLFDFLPRILDAGIEFVNNMAQGVGDNTHTIMDAIGTVLGKLLTTFYNNMPKFLEKGVQLILNVANGIIRNLPTIISSLMQVIVRLIATIAQNAPQFLQKGIELIGKLAAGLIQAIPKAVAAIPQIIRGIVNAFKGYDWGGIGRNIIDGVKNGIVNAASRLASAAVEAAKAAFNGVKNFLGIHSPSKKAEQEIGRQWSAGIGIGFEKYMPTDDMVGAVEDAFDALNGTEVQAVQTNYSTYDGNRSDGQVVMLLREMIDAIREMTNLGVYMDGKTLVGELVPVLDTAFGREVSYKGRGII